MLKFCSDQTGIGFQIALRLAQYKCRLILACRNPEKAASAAEKIKLKTGNQNIEYMVVDFASFASVKHFVQEWKKRENTRIDVLINNAGKPFPHRVPWRQLF